MLDYADIQGPLLYSYRLPYGRFLFLNLTDAPKARRLLEELAPLITTGAAFARPVTQTLNVAFTRSAFAALELPQELLASFPPEFLDGMINRAGALGDVGSSAPDQWDAMWRGRVDVWLAIQTATAAERDALQAQVDALIAETGGAVVAGVQEAAALVVGGAPVAMEHFGFADGSSQPDFTGAPPSHMPGNGKPGKDGWEAIAAGEFVLGWANEAGEMSDAPEPPILARNGSFLVYRKLEEHVRAFRDYVARAGALYPGGPEKLMAKMTGRWRDGTPVMLSPDKPDPAFAGDLKQYNAFDYADDPEGLRCPVGAHVRRTNPRRRRTRCCRRR